MTAPKLSLDHLVITARTLEEGARHVADTLGVEPTGGGAHPLMRTHNRLVNLWGGVYLEVIAIDPDAVAPAAGTRPRLFALDDPLTHARLENGPYLSHWVARVERPRNLALWQAQYPERIAPVVPMTRGNFSWTLTVPADGAFPAWHGAGDGIVPSLIQWDTPQHPTTVLPETGIALRSLKGFCPPTQVAALREQLEWLGAAHLIELNECAEDALPSLAAEFETRDGLRTLGGATR
ncbi:VOC family protein [Paraburkholderia kururiensis]|uniref:VOC family protein n=1 Tax=Paraburkholderia kururiensis TaxID=984307 RepID=A0ABZ0WI71_9BURK|nr:VOC family protein [Paraburkholderia kururiensis]WQD77062.1 VOC family protein [Paraburkholderia kururiensis]